MSQYDGSEDWQEDYRRHRRPIRTAQHLATAVTASVSGDHDVALDSLETAADIWDGYDRIGDHITDATTALEMADAPHDEAARQARYHARSAAQLLATQCDISLGFGSGGAFA